MTLRRLSPEPGAGIKLAPGEETATPGTSILRRLGAAQGGTGGRPKNRHRRRAPMEPAMPPSQPAMPSVAPGEPPVPLDAAASAGSCARCAGVVVRSASSGEPQRTGGRRSPVCSGRAVARAEGRCAAVARAESRCSPCPRRRSMCRPHRRSSRRHAKFPRRPRRPSRHRRSSVQSCRRSKLQCAKRRHRLRSLRRKRSNAVRRRRSNRHLRSSALRPRRSSRHLRSKRRRAKFLRYPHRSPSQPVAPPKIERETAPALEAPRERPAPGASGRRARRAAERARTAAIGRARQDTGGLRHPSRTDVPGEPGPRLRFGAPEPGDEIFRPRGDAAPAAESGTAPRLDLEATRQRAREIASDGSAYRGFVPAIPPPPAVDRKSKLADAIDKAQKPDCRDAYAAMGLLAVPALVVSTVGNGGCRW